MTKNWPLYSHRFEIIFRQKVLAQQRQVKKKLISCLSNTSIALVCISALGYDGVPCTTFAYVLTGEHFEYNVRNILVLVAEDFCTVTVARVV